MRSLKIGSLFAATALALVLALAPHAHAGATAPLDARTTEELAPGIDGGLLAQPLGKSDKSCTASDGDCKFGSDCCSKICKAGGKKRHDYCK
jgi:hypothetical protein